MSPSVIGKWTFSRSVRRSGSAAGAGSSRARSPLGTSGHERAPPRSRTDEPRLGWVPARHLVPVAASGACSSGGISWRHGPGREAARRERAAGISRDRSGGGPGSARAHPAASSSRGIDSSRPTSTGGAGGRRARGLGPLDNMAGVHDVDPWAIPATTPRSWVMRMSAVSRSTTARMRSRIWAWIVTSRRWSARRRSAGGSQAGHGDHHALAHAAAELVRVVLRRRLAAGIPTSSSSSTADRAPRA